MKINNLTVYDRHSKFLSVAVRLMNDKTSYSYECDVIVETDVLYVMSPEYDVVVRPCQGLYKMTVFSWTDKAEHCHLICNVEDISKAIRNIHAYTYVYVYAYTYEYLLGEDYMISPILTGCNGIHICIVDADKFNTVAGIEFCHYSDGRYMYRYHFSDSRHSVKSEAHTLKNFLEGWV